MRLEHIETLIDVGGFSRSFERGRIEDDIRHGIRAAVWPPGATSFTIAPVRKGNGVKPIKAGLIALLAQRGWSTEQAVPIAEGAEPGELDAVLATADGPFALEWETGNISSSHRALNKMALGILKRKLVGGALIVPTRRLYEFLTDRIGNFRELRPYLDLWKSVPCTNGLLQIYVVEHDSEDVTTPRIPKGTDGRAKA